MPARPAPRTGDDPPNSDSAPAAASFSGLPVAASRSDAPHADAVLAVTVGTGAWGVALVVTVLMRDRLRADAASWWVWTCATGFALGLLGSWWVRRRRARLAQLSGSGPTTPR